MHAFVGKLNGSFEKVNKFFRISIQLPNPSQKTIRVGSVFGTVFGLFLLIFGLIGGFKWSTIGGSLVVLSNLGNLLSKKK
ncbi:hypothetical protein NGI46_06310 [Peribacillus butanolivorans]|uniref:hypothetical protein n=1 Tax=Peribacillus butanolivorans TaxID=421767 RepID=UPI00207D3533|nr:hypothetical protein [Peribacillus butanolivorans]MCO0597077.1 hypothetical protein [Peribacillus butanolivorans]